MPYLSPEPYSFNGYSAPFIDRTPIFIERSDCYSRTGCIHSSSSENTAISIASLFFALPTLFMLYNSFNQKEEQRYFLKPNEDKVHKDDKYAGSGLYTCSQLKEVDTLDPKKSTLPCRIAGAIATLCFTSLVFRHQYSGTAAIVGFAATVVQAFCDPREHRRWLTRNEYEQELQK